MEFLTYELFSNSENDAKLSGLVYIRPYQEKPTKTDGVYLFGTIECKGRYQFKVWSGPTLTKMTDEDFASSICYVTGQVNEFNGAKSFIIKTIEKCTGNEFTELDFMTIKYNQEEIWNSLIRILQKNCSENALRVFDLIMEPIRDRFIMEYAAVSHHDNCIGGLLAHTMKVVRIAQTVKVYQAIMDGVSSDALFIGCALHDIGKVLEYNMGDMSEEGKTLNHLTLGLTLIMPRKDEIVELMGEDFYSTILSVVQQHHGEYGERPKTVTAYLVHLIDSIEAKFTDLSESIEAAKNDTVKCEEFYLRVK